jgi:hypothetical protein
VVWTHHQQLRRSFIKPSAIPQTSAVPFVKSSFSSCHENPVKPYGELDKGSTFIRLRIFLKDGFTFNRDVSSDGERISLSRDVLYPCIDPRAADAVDVRLYLAAHTRVDEPWTRESKHAIGSLDG